ncbi:MULTISPECIES: penicillin-binding protein activator LpoB [Brenneria]|uniref:Penicillin-binding protein activator LpoB n=1 Tax=Brenneria nigrifluens DSM 30175 = ATCC 13028 TaxID=1121120 RepID=A0A2U1USB2_9GAMM|nr:MULTISPECIES: penicillin-binding protein activator LpoB [Brenneria]EHD21047.1 membrane lipoprotein lipid attachment site [Brenneria sp. EniD312]PWC24472.1 penicillin-binding protein activator LpoB [Brenneria nigrifluens DSM 30175 = ATCC 13028]QCR04200.1 penicillin-binding protein activator LpoB [Brenneria nigrifluens DSM 30175 = ATCC 13028]
MKKYLWVVLAALVLTGCPSRPPEPTEPPATIEPAEPQVPTPPPPGEPVPPPPKIQTLNWDASINPLVAQMLQAGGVAPGSILLLDSVKNNTNGALPTAKANSALYNALSAGNTFTLVPREQVNAAKQTLGLSVDDSLGSRSKAIGLARYVGAQYVLYSDVSGDVKSPVLDMQLMLVQSGEIVWSGNGEVQR